MDDHRTESSMPSARYPCRHCDPSWRRLEEASRQMDRLELEVERRFSEQLMHLIDILLYGPGADRQKPNYPGADGTDAGS